MVNASVGVDPAHEPDTAEQFIDSLTPRTGTLRLDEGGEIVLDLDPLADAPIVVKE